MIAPHDFSVGDLIIDEDCKVGLCVAIMSGVEAAHMYQYNMLWEESTYAIIFAEPDVRDSGCWIVGCKNLAIKNVVSWKLRKFDPCVQAA